MNLDQITIRRPTPCDGYNVNNLITDCPPLDHNSLYCNLLQCSHFAETSAIATTPDSRVVGFVSGHAVPAKPETLFIWQVAVHADARGLGLGKTLIKDILSRPRAAAFNTVHTTITETNKPSHGTFTSLARDLHANISTSVFFDRKTHFNGQCDSEMLWQIGPFSPLTSSTKTQ